ncbi:hypothetical protein Tco_0849960 [Tanacetum coccineum]
MMNVCWVPGNGSKLWCQLEWGDRGGRVMVGDGEAPEAASGGGSGRTGEVGSFLSCAEKVLRKKFTRLLRRGGGQKFGRLASAAELAGNIEREGRSKCVLC